MFVSVLAMMRTSTITIELNLNLEEKKNVELNTCEVIVCKKFPP